MSKASIWTKEALSKATRVLSGVSDRDAALSAVQSAVGKRVTWAGLDNACRRTHNRGAFSFLKEAPVAAQEAREEKAGDKATIKDLVDQLREAKERQKFLNEMAKIRATPKIVAREKDSGLREMTAVVLASDWHVEEPVVAEAVAYRNEYNLTIADQRVRRFFDGIIWNIEHHRASNKVVIRDLVLWLGGDLLTGYIHEELVESNSLSPTEAVRWLLPRLRNGIKTVLETLQLDHIEVPCSHGNHGRTTLKSRIATGAENSYENLMYHCLAEEFRDEPRVHFEITASPHQYVQAYKFTLHFHHGDSLRYMGGVGGLAIPLLKAVPQWDAVKRADYHHIGHFHQLSDFGRAMVNGSLIGFGAYSAWIKASPEPPQQLFYLIDKNRGKCMSTALWVGESAKTLGVRRAA